MKSRIPVWTLPLAALLAAETTGPQTASYLSDLDGTNQTYSLYVPRSFDPSKRYPLVIGLHGAFSSHRLNLRRLFGRGGPAAETEPDATREFPPLRDVDFLVACPGARGTMGYRGIAEKDVYDVLADVRTRFRVDEDRVYLAGLDTGGGGALWMALTQPGLWAGVVVISPQVPPGLQELAGNAQGLAIRLFHGAQDPVVPVDVSRAWRDWLAAAGARVEYTELPDMRHNAWDAALRGGVIFDWFAQHKRDRFPRRVAFKTSSYRYDSAAWVRINGLVPGAPTGIEAEFTGPNKLTVRTSGLRGFTLELKGHPSYSAAAWLNLSIDGQALRTRRLAFTRREKGWVAEAFSPAQHSKRNGLEGPIADAVASRHIYVYGTLDQPGAAERERRRQAAAAAADWSSAQVRMNARFRVAADTELSEAEIQGANLVLFGTGETNRLIARHAAELPLQLDAGAADFGLFYVWPAGSRYLLVNSGLPFYTGADRVRRGGPRFLASPLAVMESLGDFVLFRGSLENVVAEGRFDENWKLTEGSRQALAASGIVRLAAPH